MCRVFLHPTTVRSPLDVARVETRTGLRAYWTGNRAELLPVDRQDRRREIPTSDRDFPKGAA